MQLGIIATLIYFKWWSDRELPTIIEKRMAVGKAGNTRNYKQMIKAVNQDTMQMFKNNKIEFMEDFPNASRLISKNPNSMKMFGQVMSSQSIFVPFALRLMGMQDSKLAEMSTMTDIPDQVLFKALDYLRGARSRKKDPDSNPTAVGDKERAHNKLIAQTKARNDILKPDF